jgi:hypothetical protein
MLVVLAALVALAGGLLAALMWGLLAALVRAVLVRLRLLLRFRGDYIGRLRPAGEELPRSRDAETKP